MFLSTYFVGFDILGPLSSFKIVLHTLQIFVVFNAHNKGQTLPESLSEYLSLDGKHLLKKKKNPKVLWSQTFDVNEMENMLLLPSAPLFYHKLAVRR